MLNLRRAFRPVLAVVFALIALTLFAGPVAAAQAVHNPSGPVAARQLPPAALASSSIHQGSAIAPRHEAGTVTTTPAPTFNQQVQNADTQSAQHKLALGITCVILLVIVYFGRRIRNRHNKKVKSTTS
ncbi:MAG TPA: hypothetical protein VHZ97_10070 [Pseudonocardiaceae bacterium]|nr:hypothetical protein [Pseudonocardiaceae bacterium]